MRRMLRGIPLLLLLAALFCSSLPADEKKADATDKTEKTDKTTDKSDSTTDKSDKTKPVPKAKKKKFEYGDEYFGKVTKLEGSSKNFTLQIPYPWLDQQKKFNNDNHYARRVLEISGDRNPQNRARQMADLSFDMARRRSDEIVQKTKDQDFQADDKTKVRIKDLPIDYDEKGKPKKYTAAEKKKLKGQGPDAKLPGYTAEYEQLQVGQLVTVCLPKKKQEKTKAKSDELDPDLIRPRVVMIYIVASPPSQP